MDATGLVPNASRLNDPVQARAQERLTVHIVNDCPVTEWSVRAYDPAAISPIGSVSRSPVVLAQESDNASGQAVVFRAPAHDAVVEVILRFGRQGYGAYYWLLKVLE